MMSAITSGDNHGRLPQAAPLVAVLMCVHQGADFKQFAEALRSLSSQTYGRVCTYIYCDGKLTQAHEEVIKAFVNTAGIKSVLIRGDGNLGLAAGLNSLIDCALTDPDVAYIARMDADDISMPIRLGVQVDYLVRTPDISIAGSWCIEFCEDNVPQFYKKMPTDDFSLRRFMLYRSPFVHPSVMIRRDVFETGIRYNANLKFMQDYDLWSRLAILGHKMSNIPQYLLWFRTGEGFYSKRAGFRRALTEVKMRIDYANQVGLLGPWNYVKYFLFILLRVSPSWAKRIAYLYLR